MNKKLNLTSLLLTMVLVPVLASCARPVPTPDTQATEAAMARALEATMTALAPTGTVTPGPTPVPSDTASPRPTATQTETATPTATVTATPIVIPEGWRQHTYPSLPFSLYLPPGWFLKDLDEGEGVVGTDGMRFYTRVAPWLCEGNDKQILRCLVETAKDTFGPTLGDDAWTGFKLVDAQATSFGAWRGYVIDHDIEIGADLMVVPWQFRVMQVWLPFEAGHCFHLYIMCYDDSQLHFPGDPTPEAMCTLLPETIRTLLFEALGTLTTTGQD